MNFITEITSNIAITALIFHVLASLEYAIYVHPLFLLVGAIVAASCAFMQTVATPPNAIVFGSGHLKIEDKIKKGLWMNVISIIILTLMDYFILPIILEFTALN